MAALASVLLALLVGCAGTEPEDPQRFGGLLHAPGPGAASTPIDVARAAQDVSELLRAVSIPHHQVGALLGPHVFHARSSLAAEAAGQPAGAGAGDEEMEVEARVEYAGDQGFRALVENSRDYGREVVYTGGYLYLRPRYSKFHRRLPEGAGEPAAIRDQVFGELEAQMDLVRAGIEVHDLGPVTHAGRSARRVELRKASGPREPRTERLGHRQWRESVQVEEVSGEIVLDQETGVPLSGTLRGQVSALRDGQRVRLRVAVAHRIESIGAPVEIAAPAADQWVPTPLGSRELEERNALLDGIAQPARAAPTPSNPSGAAAAPAQEPR